jgi:DNA-binding transcriptional ArsR family regulator
VAGKPKFTRIPKVPQLLAAGVPTEAIPTYCALADHADNKTGLCWPKMETLAHILNRSVRTVQRHLHLLKDAGLIEFVNRRRYKGRFGSYLYRVLHVRTTGHTRPVGKRDPNKRRTKPSLNTPLNPPKSAYNWWFGKPRDLEAEAERERQQAERQKQESKRRREGFEWLFS